MLTCDDLKTIDRIPNESEISLKLYAEFFETHIANRYYNIHLENNVKILMQIAPTNFPHLIALNKFKADPEFTGNQLLKYPSNLEKYPGFLNLKNEKIKIDDLKLVKDANGNSIYNLHKIRILSSPLIYQILRNSDFLTFNTNKVIGKTLIKADYVFVNDIDKNKLHLFIKDNKGINYPISFINREHSLSDEQLNYYIKNQTALKIIKIEILDYKTHNLLEVIVPGQAVHKIAEQEAAVTKEINTSSCAISIKDKIVDIYSNELPAIKFISERSAHIINSLNESKGHSLTIKEIKELHNEIGKRLEISNNKEDLEDFKTLSEVTDDIKQANLSLKQEQAHEKAMQNQITKSNVMEI